MNDTVNDDADPHGLSDDEREVIETAYAMLGAIYGGKFEALARKREPDMTRWVLEEGVQAFDADSEDDETLTRENVPQVAEVIATKTLSSTKTSFYHNYEQDPIERSIYGV